MMRAFAIAAAAALVCAAGQGEELTLQQAVSQALEGNPRVRAANARQQQAHAALHEARSSWLPHVDLSETMVSSNNPVFVFGSLLEQGRFGASNFDPHFLNDPATLRNFRLGLNVRYTLFDQFRRLDTNRQATNALEQSKAGVDDVRQAIRLEVMTKFYGLLVAQAKRNLAADAVRTAKSDEARMRDKFEQGLLVESDALAAAVQASSFRQQEIEAEGGVAIARAALNLAMGRDATADVSVHGDLPAMRRDAPPLASLLDQAMKRRGEVTAAQLGSDNARLQLSVARNSMLPRVDTFASWGASGPTFGNRNGDRSIGAVVSFDLFDGAKFSHIAQAQSAIDEARASEQSARSKVEMEIITAYEHERSAEQRIVVAQAAVQQADAAARIVRDRYEQGLTTITEHLRAQTAAVSAKVDLLNARYDLIVASADLQRATGGLHDVDAFD